jgi:hypothetical protein
MNERQPAFGCVGLSCKGLDVTSNEDQISGGLGDWMATDSELPQIRQEQAHRHKQPLRILQKNIAEGYLKLITGNPETKHKPLAERL